jgi:inosine-uridine nucleoside N-ribohydrolase
MDIHLDMETQDPDDVFALCLLATHPKSNLKGVTLFPGGFDQVGLVKHVLRRLGRPDVPVGAEGLDDGKSRVSGFHYKWLGAIPPAHPDCSAIELLLTNSGETTLITGAPLRNVGAALASWLWTGNPRGSEEVFFRNWTCQGGFAGQNVVPLKDQLEKFRGRRTCPTFNLNGDPKAALSLLKSPHLPKASMVSKNVCHGVIFGPQEAARFPREPHPGLALLLEGMQFYFANSNPKGKALHDVIAAGLTFLPEAAWWARGEPFREKGEWGFNTLEQLPPDEARVNRRITIGLNQERLYDSWVL